MENYYAILGISAKASLREVKRAFRSKAKRSHPDLGGDRYAYQLIRDAYEVLIDVAAREDYDQRLRESMASQETSSDIDIAFKIEIILAWSTTNPRFDPSVVNSFVNRLSEGKLLTAKQVLAVENIFQGFGIRMEEWLDKAKRAEALEQYFKSQSGKRKEYGNFWSTLEG